MKETAKNREVKEQRGSRMKIVVKKRGMKKQRRKGGSMKEKIKELIKDESGMGVIEVVLIIVVLVGLALVFKNQINAIASGLYDSIKDQIDNF